MKFSHIIKRLNALSNPEKAAFKKKKFNIQAKNTLGIYNSDLGKLAREIGKDADLAVQLYNSDIYEARLLAGKIFPVKELSEEQIEKWMITFENWEITDLFCMGLFAKTPFALKKINEWVDREREFERRCSFATMAAYCSHDKKSTNDLFETFFPLIKKASDDDRIYVKKAVNWALRSIGKRNRDLQKRAISFSEELLNSKSKTAQWIARDAIRELSLETVRMSDYPRNIYRS